MPNFSPNFLKMYRQLSTIGIFVEKASLATKQQSDLKDMGHWAVTDGQSGQLDSFSVGRLCIP